MNNVIRALVACRTPASWLAVAAGGLPSLAMLAIETDDEPRWEPAPVFATVVGLGNLIMLTAAHLTGITGTALQFVWMFGGMVWVLLFVIAGGALLLGEHIRADFKSATK